jgi:hypothetical protein
MKKHKWTKEKTEWGGIDYTHPSGGRIRKSSTRSYSNFTSNARRTQWLCKDFPIARANRTYTSFKNAKHYTERILDES